MVALTLLTDTESQYLFPSSRGDGPLRDSKVIRRACDKAGFDGVSLHTLRHSFASVANELGYTEMTVAGLLGHRMRSVTSRYTHNVDRALVAASDRISALIAARMAGDLRRRVHHEMSLPQAYLGTVAGDDDVIAVDQA